jgi:hypothetical protein
MPKIWSPKVLTHSNRPRSPVRATISSPPCPTCARKYPLSERFCDGADGRRFVSPNFVLVDDAGQIYVSDNGTPNVPGPGVFRFSPDGSGELWHEGPFNFANGMALTADGRTLYVVRQGEQEIATVQLSEDYTKGRVVSRFKDPALAWPATAAKVGDRLLVVNSQFNQRQAGTAQTPFTVLAVPLSRLGGE